MKHPRPNRVMAECTARHFTRGMVRPHTSANNREKKRTCDGQECQSSICSALHVVPTALHVGGSARQPAEG